MDRKRYFGISLLINNRLSEDAHLDFRVSSVVSDASTFRLRRPCRLAGNVSAIRFHLGLKLDPRFIRRKFAVVGLWFSTTKILPLPSEKWLSSKAERRYS